MPSRFGTEVGNRPPWSNFMEPGAGMAWRPAGIVRGGSAENVGTKDPAELFR